MIEARKKHDYVVSGSLNYIFYGKHFCFQTMMQHIKADEAKKRSMQAGKSGEGGTQNLLEMKPTGNKDDVDITSSLDECDFSKLDNVSKGGSDNSVHELVGDSSKPNDHQLK